MERWLSRKVKVDGKQVGPAVVTVDGDNVTVTAFETETEATLYTDAEITVDTGVIPPRVTFINNSEQ